MKNYLPKLHSRWQELPEFHGIGDIFLFVRIFLFAAMTPVLMRLGLPRLQSVLSPKVTSAPVNSARVCQIADYVEAAISSGHPLIHNSCLTRGLTRYYFLSKGGLNVALCFGIGQVKENFEGHCWLVKNGEPFLEKQDPRPLFETVYSIPAITKTS